MAVKRMFSTRVVWTDRFLDLPLSAQCLYFHLGMAGDDDGFVDSPRRITAMCGANPDDLKLLSGKGFVYPFSSGVCVVVDWATNNTLKNDRYHETIYKQEKAAFERAKSSGLLGWNQNGTKAEPEHNITEQSIAFSCYQPALPAAADEEKKTKKKAQPIFPPESEAYKCAGFLAAEIHRRLPKAKEATEATLQKWAAEFDRLHRLDGYGWEEICAVLDFSQRDSFWQTVILSGKKFRGQFVTLMAKMEGAHG